MQSQRMKELSNWISSEIKISVIPVRIKNEKRWESMDEIIEKTPFEGVPHRINFSDGYGVILYSWDEIEPSIENQIIDKYKELKDR